MAMVCCGTDECDVECPLCDASNNLQDVLTDRCLKTGFEFECVGCKTTLRIAAVDWSPTIWLEQPPSTPESGSGTGAGT